MQGPSFPPTAHLSKQLDTTIQGWPACLCALAIATLLTQESKKLTFGTPTVICSQHDLKDLTLTQDHGSSITFSYPTNSTLRESPEFSFERCPTLNPATLIPNSSEPAIHTCKKAEGPQTPQQDLLSSDFKIFNNQEE